jgi:hypothetical protein
VTIREKVARAIYGAAFENRHGGLQPEPGWCWERAGEIQQLFCFRQAAAALAALPVTVEELEEIARTKKAPTHC